VLTPKSVHFPQGAVDLPHLQLLEQTFPVCWPVVAMRKHATLAGSIDQINPMANEPRVKASDYDESYPRRRVGVSFCNLSCNGFVKSERYQATVFSYLLAIPKFFINLVRTRPAHEVKLLQDFEGLIRPGEMLLVLGRPGSGCSTFLKTLSGETNGFEIASESDICYQGMYHGSTIPLVFACLKDSRF
jgi:ABC-type multidrug transport system fused ATPase/permease subunit